MEITELNLISDFEAGVNCLQNPSLISQFLPLSTFPKTAQIYGGALIILILAAFSGLIARIKFLIFEIFRIKLIPAVDSIKLLNDDDFDSDEDDDVADDETCSSVSSDEDEEYEERESSLEDEYSSAAGGICRRFSWSDFAAGKSVVKLWDNLATAFDWDEDQSDEVVSVWDVPGDKRGAPAVVLSAENVRNGGVSLGLYDNRVRKGSPEMTAEWPSLRRRAVAGVGSDEVGTVYVRDDVTGELTVGDLRNVKSPLEWRRVSGASTWWDVDGVIVSDESCVNYR